MSDVENNSENNRLPLNVAVQAYKDKWPYFGNTRVPVDHLWGYFADGYTIDQFLESYPTVTREQVRSVLFHAGDIFAERFTKDESAL